KSALGAPFNVYAPGKYLQEGASGGTGMEAVKAWPIAVAAGDSLGYNWPLNHFENEEYHLRVYGPNGFFREFSGNTTDPDLNIRCGYQKKRGILNRLSGNIQLDISNTTKKKMEITIEDHAYGHPEQKIQIGKNTIKNIVVTATDSHGWYDFSVRVKGFSQYNRRYAGRIETGEPSKSDPFMGRTIV
ncbi:MAG TPA: phospholipase domain-containing protein, partial [Arenibacter sp.]|nr:phospholipase domain-containing protein [Arenibacter sp.]